MTYWDGIRIATPDWWITNDKAGIMSFSECVCCGRLIWKYKADVFPQWRHVQDDETVCLVFPWGTI